MSNRMRSLLLLALVFSVTFLSVFLGIILSQSAYSTPPAYTLYIDGMGIKVGPPPNSTGIPLDTRIIIDALTPASLADFQMTPQVTIARSSSENSSPLTYLNSFYPAHPLKPATFYTVSVIVMNLPVSWSFTTAEVFSPGISFYLTTNAFWIALLTAVLVTLISGHTLRLRSKAKSKQIVHQYSVAHVFIHSF